MTPAGIVVRAIVGVLIFIPVLYIVHRAKNMYNRKYTKWSGR